MNERMLNPNKMPEIMVWKAKIDPQESFQLERVNLLPSPQSFDDASQMLPSGVYTTFRTFNGEKILSLQNQVNRLEQSAILERRPMRVKIASLRQILHKVVHSYSSAEKRVRISIDLKDGTVYILIEPLRIPSKDQYEHGVRLVTVHHKRQNPRAKRTQFIDIAQTFRKQHPEDINDLLMVDDDGFILEGLNSNFFAVRDGQIFTAGGNVLSGITREIVLNIIREMKLPHSFAPIHIHDLNTLEEAFLTSASRSVLSVAQIDQVMIREPIPGALTTSITNAYWNYVTARLENL
jgi:branched-chain amino acid aminotransferase